MAAIWGAVIGGAVALIGDQMSSSGQQDTNAQNLEIARENNQFNSQQAELSRSFSAQQVANQQEFQREQIAGAEAYNTNMADTQIQRRAQDLRTAGLNPLLAVAQPAASPTISPAMGSVGSSAQAQSSGNPTMQNPQAAFGNLGGQTGTAIQAASAAANIDLMKAQTAKLQAESGQEIPAQVQYLQSMTGLNTAQASQVKTNIDFINEQILKTSSEEVLTRNKTVESEMQQRIQQQDLWVKQATRDALISATQSDATAKALGLQGLRNLNDVQQGEFGRVITYLNAILKPASSAAALAH